MGYLLMGAQVNRIQVNGRTDLWEYRLVRVHINGSPG